MLSERHMSIDSRQREEAGRKMIWVIKHLVIKTGDVLVSQGFALSTYF
jgi:hypothetical protein